MAAETKNGEDVDDWTSANPTRVLFLYYVILLSSLNLMSLTLWNKIWSLLHCQFQIYVKQSVHDVKIVLLFYYYCTSAWLNMYQKKTQVK